MQPLFRIGRTPFKEIINDVFINAKRKRRIINRDFHIKPIVQGPQSNPADRCPWSYFRQTSLQQCCKSFSLAQQRFLRALTG